MLAVALSPGGLLLPYHLGVLEALSEYNVIDARQTPISGASAGAIAVSGWSGGVSIEDMLEATIQMSRDCGSRAQGRLLPLLRQELETLLTDEVFAQLTSRPAFTGIVYREVFPKFWNKQIQSRFETKEDLIQAVLKSSSFPFFTSNWPFFRGNGKRLSFYVDGYFAVPRRRFGCPDLTALLPNVVDRTLCVSCFPMEVVGMIGIVDRKYCIAPAYSRDTIKRYARVALTPS